MLLHPKFNTLRTPKVFVPQIKALVIQIQDLKFAIPIELLVKVMRTPIVFKSGDKWMGMSQLDDEGLLIIDLYRKIYGTDNPKPMENLVIVRDVHDSAHGSAHGSAHASVDRLLGIPVSLLPTLISVPSDSLQALPEDYREYDSLGIASHMAILNPADPTDSLFFLDPKRLFSPGE
jgi:chemotaxis signal transduction protein